MLFSFKGFYCKDQNYGRDFTRACASTSRVPSLWCHNESYDEDGLENAGIDIVLRHRREKLSGGSEISTIQQMKSRHNREARREHSGQR